ncbi:MAG: M3 family metallopeptidase [Porticoccaceae bacterium]|jgi:oligopeptidase A|nr:M3 family metallopeptidase [Porticoccaceae bacterium]HLS99025.1 M3 family metallopeptidase [Porticoccaceae bacterium]
MTPPDLPRFSDIDIGKLPQQLAALLDDSRQRVASLLAAPPPFTWDNLMAPLEAIDDRLEKFWSPVAHLNGVMNSDELRAAYDACIPLLTAWHSEMGQNRPLFEAVQSLADSPAFAALGRPRQQAVRHMLRDFRLSGVALPEAERQRFAAIEQRLSELATKFSNNVLDATDGWEKYLEDESALAGIPDSALAGFRQQAKAQGKEGYRLTLAVPAYLPVMQYADNRALRRELYEAYATRASDQGPGAGRWDNSALMVEILQLREEMARLLGFANYAELSLAPKMAESPAQVEDFLVNLVAAAKPQGEAEVAEVRRFAGELGCADPEAWDIPYYSEKLRERDYALNQEQLRPYFPANRVIEGLFAITGQLFGIRFEPREAVDLWHPDARCYSVLRDGAPIAVCYLDLYARAKKRGGAWMADYCGRRRTDVGTQLPVAFLTCNFTPPTGDRPALLTHDEVTTLFHEFGHGLHHMLTEIDVLKVAGINGVAWDAVELPSQFLENWCWQRESIPLISGHFETGEPLPGELLDKMLAARNFQSAMQMLRQLEFALFDLRLHSAPAPASGDDIQRLLDGVRAQVAVLRPPAFNRFQHGFGHIFAGGYAAGYYSYKWAEVLSADAFSLFEEEGVMNGETGRKFHDAILARGGSEDALDLFVAFRGREPDQAALLRHSGIQSG